MITGFQLRAAKAALELTAKEIGMAIGVHYGTLIRLGHTKNLEYLRCNAKNMILLKKFFENKNILFPDEHTISLKIGLDSTTNTPNTGNLTRFQLKIARVAAGLTQSELAYYVKLSSSSISIMEQLKDLDYIESTKLDIMLLKKFFEHAGIIFPNDLTILLIRDPQILLKKTKIVIDAKSYK